MRKLKRTNSRQRRPPQKDKKLLLLIFKSGKLRVEQHAEIATLLKRALPENIKGFIIPDSTSDHAQLFDISAGQMTKIPESILKHIQTQHHTI